jgi:hypothetical protein
MFSPAADDNPASRGDPRSGVGLGTLRFLGFYCAPPMRHTPGLTIASPGACECRSAGRKCYQSGHWS